MILDRQEQSRIGGVEVEISQSFLLSEWLQVPPSRSIAPSLLFHVRGDAHLVSWRQMCVPFELKINATAMLFWLSMIEQ